ncbi:MAG: TIGR03118 family protein [Steroidobacteraceae bacterium]|jgi:uncharacterized protein (TIGR03118 family)
MKLPLCVQGKYSIAPLVGVACGLLLAACGGGGGGSGSAAPVSGFSDTALVSNSVGVVAVSTIIDSNLQNPWGIAFAPGQPFWIADNNNNLSTLYSGTGEIKTNAVTGSTDVGIAIPASAAGVPSNPTGQVYNGGGGFMIATGMGQESALFIFDGEGGVLSGWAADSGASAVTAYDDGVLNGANHAVYKGLAIATLNGAAYLYATDLHNNKVDVFDTNFSKPAAMQGKFQDPTMPAGFVPFGITVVQDQLYVTYAMQDAAMHDEVTGAGLGYVDVFDFSGNFVSRFASAGALNAPWGIAVVPSGFGTLGGNLLIGNFGDGHINIFSSTGTSMGALSVSNGGTVSIPGLWSLVFGNGDADKPLNTLFYTAGFADQTDGVFGTIAPTTMPSGSSPY